MNLKTALFILLFGISNLLQAQNFLINQDFSTANDTVPPTGWINKMITGDAQYDKVQFGSKVFNYAKPLVKNFAVMDCYNGGSAGASATNGQGEEIVLISPVVSTASLSNLTLSFDKQFFVQAGAEIHIQVSTNGGSTWTNVYSQTAAIVEGSPSNLSINLNSYTGNSNFRLRFRWYNGTTTTYRGFFAFDNVQLFESKSIDVRVSEIVEMYDNSCPSANQSLNLTVYNAGTSTQSVIPVVLKIGSTTLYDTAKNLSAGARVSVFTSKTFDASSGGNYSFVAYTNLSTDLVRANDTLKQVRKSASPPAVPSSGTINKCGVGSATLTTSRNSGDSTYWFLTATGGTDVGTGSPFKTPYIDKTTTFYVENSRVIQNDFTSSAGLYRFNGAVQPGSYFNLQAKNEILLDSVGQHFAYTGNYTMNVYYRTGTYGGYETSSASWTKIDLVKDTVNVAGYGKFYILRFKKALRIPAGSTYGFYVQASASSITFTNGALDEQNADVRLTGNAVSSAAFNGLTAGYYWNGRIFYRKTCSTGRKAITVNILPRPKGVQFVAGSVFNGNFRSGTPSNFDVAALKRTISYEILPPTGYTNSDFGTKWAITRLDMSSVKGTPIPTKDTTMVAPGAANGKLSYTPSAGWEDSTIVIRVWAWDSKNGCDTTVERYIFVAPTPRPNFEAPSECLGTSIAFVNLSKIASGYLSYSWNFGDGNSSTFESPIHTYLNYGKYQVKLTVTSDYGIVSDTTIQIEVFEIPDVKFQIINACENVDIKFNNATTISSGTLLFNWNFGDNQKSTLKSPTHKYAAPGGYKVTLVASANGCNSSLTKFATQFPRPKSSFSSTGGCVGSPVDFVNTSTIALGEKIGSKWYFDDGNLGTVSDPSHIYTNAGTKNVKLVSVSQFGCEDSISKAIVIKASPVASFSYDKNCDADPVNFTNTTIEPSGSIVVYSWMFGDGGISSQKNPSHKYNSLGRKTISLVALSNNGCSQTVTREISIIVQPVADFQVSAECSGEPVHFTNKTKLSTGEISYKWYFGDGDSSDFVAPVKIYDVSTTTVFIVKLEAKAKGGCTDIVTRNVTINETPNCGFTMVQSKTDRQTYTFTPNNKSYGASAYTWIMKGSGIYNVISPTHTFDYADHTYNVILDITANKGCNCTDSTVYIKTSWPLGVNQLEEITSGYRIFPNPSNGSVTVVPATNNLSNVASINIYGQDGRLVARFEDLTIDLNGIKLDLHQLSSGIYNVEVSNSSYRSIQRLVIAN